MNKIAKFFRDYSFAGFVLPFGLILIAVSIVVFGIVDTRKAYPQTDAVITRCELAQEGYYDANHDWQEATYHVFVRYAVDGAEYEEEYGVLPEMKAGEKVRIDYNPQDPRDISQPTGIIVPIVMSAAGAAALIAGAVSIVRTRKKNDALKRQEEEWKHGQ